jgi:hypothetical protein
MRHLKIKHNEEFQQFQKMRQTATFVHRASKGGEGKCIKKEKEEEEVGANEEDNNVGSNDISAASIAVADDVVGAAPAEKGKQKRNAKESAGNLGSANAIGKEEKSPAKKRSRKMETPVKGLNKFKNFVIKAIN